MNVRKKLDNQAKKRKLTIDRFKAQIRKIKKQPINIVEKDYWFKLVGSLTESLDTP